MKIIKAQTAKFSTYTILALYLGACQSHLPDEIEQAYPNLPEIVDFNFHIKPLLSDRCYKCHGPDEKARKADLRLDTEEHAFAKLKESEGYAFVKGNIRKSVAWQRIISDDPKFQMPPPDSHLSLTDEEKALIAKWIDQGAEWKPHWSFIRPEKAVLPKVKDKTALQNSIDHFVLARLEREGMSFSEPADKETLIRRVSLDLTGLPPSIEEVDDFLKDGSVDAYEKVVDRLLASPKFGERWAWDWLDAARYSDTNGFQNDPTRKMWPWRDWVIRTINENMPFDQFTIEQLAGDLLPDASQDQIIATAFNRNHMHNGEGGRIMEETRVENVFDRLETTSTIWMGLTFNCARCHDHKFDPISQREYYGMFDYFNQTSEMGDGLSNSNVLGVAEPVLDLSPPKEKEELARLQAFVDEMGQKMDQYEHKIFPREDGPASASDQVPNLDGDILYALDFRAAERTNFTTNLIYEFYEKRDPVYAKLAASLRDALSKRDNRANNNLRVMVMDQIEEPRPTIVLDRGSYDQPTGDTIKAMVPAVLPPLEGVGPNNRLKLANWIISEAHPLTARVTVNRFWQSLFGRGLVKTPDDFGVQGAKPTHPQLLDWLAVDFVENAWDVKALMKKIVLSRTYQQSSKMNDRLLEKDPDNTLLGRAPRYRLPSWMIRDQALMISSLLVDSMGGPSVKPYQPEGIWEEATFGIINYKQDRGQSLYRRTLYTFWRRIVGPTMLFDNSERQVCSVKPILTSSPQHALITLNDITYAEAARVMAERVMKAEKNEDKQIDLAFRLATSRFPSQKEREILKTKRQEFLVDFKEKTGTAGQVVSIGEFRPADNLDPLEHAAFTTLCSMILNLDETISKQ